MNNMPPMPATRYTTDYHMDGKGFPVYTAGQLQDYAMLCVDCILTEKRKSLESRIAKGVEIVVSKRQTDFDVGFQYAVDYFNTILEQEMKV